MEPGTPGSAAALRAEELRAGDPCRQADLQFPALPTLLSTRLQLQLALSDHSVDLRAATGVLLNDLGATLEVFRRAGQERASADAGSARLEDCLASLGTDVWIEIVSAEAVERVAAGEAELAELTAFWEHGRLLGYACWLVAQRMEGVCPDDAYLFGLLHEMGRLPGLLGWDGMTQDGGDGGDAAMVSQLAEHWHLPDRLRAALAVPASVPSWAQLLETAHSWARGGDCLLRDSA